MFDVEIFRRAGDPQEQTERGQTSRQSGRAARAVLRAAHKPVLTSFANVDQEDGKSAIEAGTSSGDAADREGSESGMAVEPEITVGEAELARLLGIAWQKGFDEGSRTEVASQDARKAAACEALVTGVDRCVSALAESRAILEQRFADTACAIIRTVAGAFRLHARADLLRFCIEERLDDLREADRILLAINPQDVALIRDDVLPALPADHQALGFEIVARQAMSAGALEIDWQRSWSDFDFARLESGIQDLFNRHWRSGSDADAAPIMDEGKPA